jgi:hypothetical protein
MYYELNLYPLTALEMCLVGIDGINTRSIHIPQILFTCVALHLIRVFYTVLVLL